jgi:hypothetical protein
MDCSAKELVQKQIAVGHWRRRATEYQMAREAQCRCGGGSLTAMIGLRCARRDYCVAALLERVSEEEFKLSSLVAAECEPGEVIAFSPQAWTTEV